MGLDREECVMARAVRLVVSGEPEKALTLLSRYYGIPTPHLKVGLPRRCRKALGCYVASKRTIHVRSSSEYADPFVILHEFYHHLRSVLGMHRGTERYADQYAMRAIRAAASGVCSVDSEDEG